MDKFCLWRAFPRVEGKAYFLIVSWGKGYKEAELRLGDVPQILWSPGQPEFPFPCPPRLPWGNQENVEGVFRPKLCQKDFERAFIRVSELTFSLFFGILEEGRKGLDIGNLIVLTLVLNGVKS